MTSGTNLLQYFTKLLQYFKPDRVCGKKVPNFILVDVHSPHVKTMKEGKDKNIVLPTLKEIFGR
jgi:hypothetical protein